MAKAGYTLQTGAAVALTAATAKSVPVRHRAGSVRYRPQKVKIGFDGVTASAVPVLCELMTSTLATNRRRAPATPRAPWCSLRAQHHGRVHGFYNSTAEPTVLTAFDLFLLTPTGGLLFYDYPLGDTPDTAVSNGIVLRCTAPLR